METIILYIQGCENYMYFDILHIHMCICFSIKMLMKILVLLVPGD